MSSFNQTDPRKHSLALDIQKAQKAPPEVGRAALAAIRADLNLDSMASWWDVTLQPIDRARFCRLANFPEGSHVSAWSEFGARDQALMKRAVRISGNLAATMPGGA